MKEARIRFFPLYVARSAFFVAVPASAGRTGAAGTHGAAGCPVQRSGLMGVGVCGGVAQRPGESYEQRKLIVLSHIMEDCA